MCQLLALCIEQNKELTACSKDFGAHLTMLFKLTCVNFHSRAYRETKVLLYICVNFEERS